MSSDNDLIRRGDALVKARPFCESQGDEWDRGYNTAISHYQVALLALTAISSAAFDEGALAEKIADALRKSDLHNFDSLHAAQIAARVAREWAEGK